MYINMLLRCWGGTVQSLYTAFLIVIGGIVLHPPERNHALTEPANVILFGKRVFADIIHLRISKWDRHEFSVGPKSNGRCSYKKRGDRNTQRRRWCEKRGWDWSHAVQRTPWASSSWERPGRILPRALGGSRSCQHFRWHPDLGLPASTSVEDKFLWF